MGNSVITQNKPSNVARGEQSGQVKIGDWHFPPFTQNTPCYSLLWGCHGNGGNLS